MPKIVIYSGPDCPYCQRTKMLLKNKGMDFEEINVRIDAAKREEMLQRSNGRKTIPQIFINDQHIGGFDDLNALNEQGKLDPLLAS